MSWGYGYSEYKSVAEQRAKAQKQLAKLRKKDPGIQPVVIEGRKITTTWWGNSWCENFKRYADFENRISRGSVGAATPSRASTMSCSQWRSSVAGIGSPQASGS